jgi:hypothetical protein
VVVWLLKAPTPVKAQLTPLPLESLETLAVMFTLWLALSDALLGVSVTEITTPAGVPLLPHPTRNPRAPIKVRTKKLRTLSSLL